MHRSFRLWPWRWWQWILLGIVTLFVLGRVLLPELLRRELVASLSKATPALVRLADVDIDLLRGKLVLHGLSLTLSGEAHPVLSIDEIVSRAKLSALMHGELDMEDVQFSGIRATVVRHANGQLNFSRLLLPPTPDPSPEKDLPTIMIAQVRLADVSITYRDLTHTPESLNQLSLHEFTTGPVSLQANGLAAAVPVQWRGQLSGATVTGDGQVYWSRSETRLEATMSLQQLAIALIEPYLRGSLSVRKLSGEMSTRLRYRFQSGRALPSIHTLDGAVSLLNLSFVDPSLEQTALQVQDGRIIIEQVDFLRHDLRLATIELHNPQALVLSTSAGLNWAHFFSPPDEDATSVKQKSETNSTWRSTIQSVKVTGGEISYRDSDWQKAQTIKISPEEVELHDLSDETTESPLQFSVRLGEGQLRGAGTLQLSPLQVRAQAQLSKFTLSPIQPLLIQALAIRNAEGVVDGNIQVGWTMDGDAPLVSLSGELDASGMTIDGLPTAGNLLAWTHAHVVMREGSTLAPLSLNATAQLTNMTLQRLPQGDVSLEQVTSTVQLTRRVESKEAATPQLENSLSGAADPLRLEVQGTFEVKNFLLAQGSDKEELLSCYQAQGQVKAGSRLLPLELYLAEVTLEYPYAQGFRTTSGRFQLVDPSSVAAPVVSIPVVPVESSTVSASTSSTQGEAASSETPPLLHIDRVVLIGGQVYFKDHAIAPAQTIYWQDIRVDLSDMSYPLERPTAFALHAFNMDGAPIEASGTTERQNNQLVTRIHGTIDRMTLKRFNAYLTPVLGYQVRKGAVSVQWELLIPGDLLQASASVTLHDLGLSGKQSTSDLEQQIGLPMSLIIALLKDLNGNINLRLPVEGRWGEPGFHLGGTLWRAIKDVLVGAVTSPLKFLGAIFSGKETLEDFFLEPIPFIPGANQLTLAGKEQVNRLRVFLTQRPELDVQLSGATGSADRVALQDRLLLTQLAEAPPPRTPEAENAEPRPSVTPEEEVRQFLSQQFEHGERQTASLSEQASALLKKLREQTVIEPPMLEQLASERVQAVWAALTENPGVAAGRLRLSPEKPRGRGAPEVQYMIQAREDRKKK